MFCSISAEEMKCLRVRGPENLRDKLRVSRKKKKKYIIITKKKNQKVRTVEWRIKHSKEGCEDITGSLPMEGYEGH